MLSIRVIVCSLVPQSAPIKAANRPASSSDRSPCYAPNQIYKDKQSNFLRISVVGVQDPQMGLFKEDRPSDLERLAV